MASQKARNPLKSGSAINRWEMTSIRTEPFAGVARPTPDTIDYCFGFNRSNFGGESPAREALRKRGPLPNPTIPHDPFKQFHPGGSEANVDHSKFYFTPTLVTRGYRCAFHASEAGEAKFRILTPGNVRMWLNKKLVARLEKTDRPNAYARNHESHLDVELSFPKGNSEMVIELEQLAERDTSFFFALTYKSGIQLSTFIDNSENDRLQQISDTLATLEADRIFYTNEPFILVTESPLPFDLPIKIRNYQQFNGGDSLSADEKPVLHALLKAFETQVKLPQSFEMPVGCFHLDVETEVAGLKITRNIGSSNIGHSVKLSGKTITERKIEVADLIASTPGSQTSNAYLLLSRDERMDLVERIMGEAIISVEERRDCSDFGLIALLRIWQDFRGKLSEALRDRLKKAILGYRYWLTEPGNDAMWFWSENHILCFHIAQYLAGKEFPSDVFPNSGKTGKQHFEEARGRLNRWFDSAEAEGFSECNSSAYYPVDVYALLILCDGTDDKRFKQRSKTLMDVIFVMSAMHNLGGSAAGAQGRTYEKEQLSGFCNELSCSLALAYGGDWVPRFDRVNALFACSDYEPPEFAKNLLKPNAKSILQARYTQGFNDAAKLTLWKSAHAQLSSYTEHMTGVQGRQEHLLDLQFAAHPLARVWVNHPGDLKPWSERRPSKLAGSFSLPRVAQSENEGFAIFDLSRVEYSLPFTQLFACPDALDVVIEDGNWVFVRSGSGCAAIWCSVAPELESTGVYRNTVRRAHALQAGWTITVATVETQDEFKAFCDAQKSAPPEFDTAELILTKGDLKLEFDGGFFKNGTSVVFGPLTCVPQFSFDGAPLKPWTDCL